MPTTKLSAYKKKRNFSKTREPKGKASFAKRTGLFFVVQRHDASHLHFDFRLELDGVLKSWAVPKGIPDESDEKRLAVMVEDHPLEYRKFHGTIPKGNYGAGEVAIWDSGTYHAKESTDRQQTEHFMRKGLKAGKIEFFLQGKKLSGLYTLVHIHTKEKNSWLLLKNRHAPTQQFDISAAASIKTFPHYIKPMLAVLVDKPFDKKEWIFEIKWDGYRAIAEIKKDTVRLYSRNRQNFHERYPLVIDSLKRVRRDAVFDGEIVIVDSSGKPDFQMLQNYTRDKRGKLMYYIFDLLAIDGKNITGLPLLKRKALLKDLLPHTPNVSYGDHIEEQGASFFKQVQKEGLEGIMAKNGNSSYQPGIRSSDWLKIKTLQRQEVVIGGFTTPRKTRKNFGALVVGVYEKGILVYVGHVGGGFDEKALLDMRKKLTPLVQKECPFADVPETNTPATWVKPVLLGEVKFAGWTEDRRMRQPVFVGLRTDKKARDVHQETPVARQTVLEKEKDSVSLDGIAVSITNTEKIYFPEKKYTKGDLIHYYHAIAPYMFPYLKDRPQSLNRHPDGIYGGHFFHKNITTSLPSWVKTTKIHTEGETIHSIVSKNKATLLYLANLGCIEINPWSSRVGNLDKPDFMVIDLDPHEISFRYVVKAALCVKKVLDSAGAQSFCKTSGKKGLHVFVPLGAKYDYDHVKQFAEIVANLANRMSSKFSVVRSPEKRPNKVYLDFLQNRKGQTLAAPYSVRPTPEATVSTPLSWKEVNDSLDPKKFTIQTILPRVKRKGDLWKGVLGKGIDLKKVLEKLKLNNPRG